MRTNLLEDLDYITDSECQLVIFALFVTVDDLTMSILYRRFVSGEKREEEAN